MSDDIDINEAELQGAMAVLFGKGFGKDKSKRKAREKKIRQTTDGRSLHATGRTYHFGFKCKPQVHDLVVDAARDANCTMAEWMESAILAKLGVEG